eukprot:CAMPEP_0115463054 /NCGR_PEP_ID=MMETSP0271-20121206/48142_1 /TAXON_ID=71861 /ORGANISM="Scrippsiella trochoidea, Strain CCMP3099" /LENGTH=492 /DNA_ID=CAMNT_0002889861 /DNA_START=27 /DNA_END=1505 /DNA_ORIENTATION=+
MAVPLLIPRTHDAEKVQRYTYRVVPLWVVLGSVYIAPFYGFNVWVLDVLREFGISSLWSQLQVKIIMAFALATFIVTLVAAIIAPLLSRFGARSIYLAGIVTSSAALVASGQAVAMGSLPSSYAAWAILFGAGAGSAYLVVLTCCVSWFRRCGAPGHGAGLFGFVMGLWPALFSYAAPAAVNVVGVANSFYLAAAAVLFIGVWPALLLCMPEEIPAAPAVGTSSRSPGEVGKKNTEAQDLESAETASTPSDFSSIESSERAAEVHREQAPSGMQKSITRTQVLMIPEFWLLWWQVFLATLPGFGIKYLVAPMMVNIFDASQAQHAAASCIFLMCYAVTRLAAGLIVGPLMSARGCLRMLVAFQVLACAGAWGFLSHKSHESGHQEHHAYEAWIFVALIACIGSTLAGIQVMVPLLSLELGGPAGLSVVTGLMLTSYGLAAFLGPIGAWVALAADGGPGSSLAVAAWFRANAAATLLAALLGFVRRQTTAMPQ